jgi:hypothetical protein
MRKYLTAKLFKRLSLAALVLSLVGWGMSEFCVAYASTPFVTIQLAKGEILITIGDISERYPDRFFVEGGWQRHSSLNFPVPVWGDDEIIGVIPLRIRYAVIPLWLLSFFALSAFLFFRRRDRRAVIPPGRCVHCGYDASRCTDNRCSECGEPLAVEAVATESSKSAEGAPV